MLLQHQTMTASPTNQQLPEPTAMPAAQNQEVLLERLIDSYAALREVKTLTDQMGSFVVYARVQADRLPAATIAKKTLKRKRDDVYQEEEDDEHDDSTDHAEDDDDEDSVASTEKSFHVSRSSAKRMMTLYCHLQKTQALLEEEMEKFIDETQALCHGDQEDEGVSACAE